MAEELVAFGSPIFASFQQFVRVHETAVNDIQHLFNQLPVSEREVMALRYGCQLNFAEIAAILNNSCEAVRATLQQGRWRAANLEQIRLDRQN